MKPNSWEQWPAKAPMTAKPCPGCGGLVTFGTFDGQIKREPFRRVDEVCDECKDLIAEAKQARERQQTDRMREIRNLTGPSYEHGASFYERTIDKIVHDLVLATSEAVPEFGSAESSGYVFTREADRPKHFGKPWSYGWISINPHVASLFDELDRRVIKALGDEYARGWRDGSRMLQRLATGEITPAQFEEAEAKAGARK